MSSPKPQTSKSVPSRSLSSPIIRNNGTKIQKQNSFDDVVVKENQENATTTEGGSHNTKNNNNNSSSYNKWITIGLSLLTFFVLGRTIRIDHIHMKRMNEYGENDKRFHLFIQSIVEGNSSNNIYNSNMTGRNHSIIPKPSNEKKSVTVTEGGDGRKERGRELLILNKIRRMTVAQSISNMTNHYTLRPLLSTLLDGKDKHIIGNVSFLLDFAILGFAKCGTSTMMKWLGLHTSEILVFQNELTDLMAWKPHLLVQLLYTFFPDDQYNVTANNKNNNASLLSSEDRNLNDAIIKNVKLDNSNSPQSFQNASSTTNNVSIELLHKFLRGYKAPGDITQSHVLDYYRIYFYNSKIIIGVRHPIIWLESMYNFRVQNNGIYGQGLITNDTRKLIGRCTVGTQNCCTLKANFAHYLIRLGKQYLTTTTTNINDSPSGIINTTTIIPIEQRRQPTQLETEIVWKYKREAYNITAIDPLLNPIFLFDLNQLSTIDETDESKKRIHILRNDIKEFLNLKNELPELLHFKPGLNYQNDIIQKQINKMKINICDKKHDLIRAELLIAAQQSSIWIRTIFINSPTVHISSRDYFIQLLESWMIDPCTLYNSTKYMVV